MKVDVIYEKSSVSMCACWGSVSKRAEACPTSSWPPVLSTLWENGFHDVSLQPHPQSFSLGNLLEPITAPSSSPILTCCGVFSKGNPWRLTRTGPALHCRHSYWSLREWRAVRRLNLSLQNSLLWAELRKWRNNWRESTLSSPQDHKGIGDEVSNVGMELKMWLFCRHLYLVSWTLSMAPLGQLVSGRLRVASVYSINIPPGYTQSGEWNDCNPIIQVNLPSIAKPVCVSTGKCYL